MSSIIGLRPIIQEFLKPLTSLTVASDLEHLNKFHAEGRRVLATHNGHFHCDEALATGLLYLASSWKGVSVIRTRQPDLINKCDIVVDVGGVYDPTKNRFDHHQASFTKTFSTPTQQFHTRMSSAGLVFYHFGREILKNFAAYLEEQSKLLTPSAAHNVPKSVTPEALDAIYLQMYRKFVEAVDGIDNGVDLNVLQCVDAKDSKDPADPNAPKLDVDATPDLVRVGVPGGRRVEVTVVNRYVSSGTLLASRVGGLNARWTDDEGDSPDKENARFCEAVRLTTGEFFTAAEELITSWWPARAIVQKALADAKKVHPSGAIILLEESRCPWKDHLQALEGDHSHVLYALFSQHVGLERNKGPWRVQAVPVTPNSFDCRKPFPVPWRGVRDDELSKVTGIPGCIFVHASGFIGGNQTYEGALEMAIKSMNFKA